MTSSIITTKFNGETHPDKAYVATIHCPGALTLTRVPSLVSIDSNQNCKIVIENCAPYEVTIERNDIMGLVEIGEDEMYPLTDEAAADICATIKSNIPNTPRTKLTRDDILKQCNLQVPEESKTVAWTSSLSTRMPSAWTDFTWGWPGTTNIDPSQKRISGQPKTIQDP
jgi:hypothetical protein